MWPALEVVLEGYATLGDVCGGPPTLDDVQLLSMAAEAWHDAKRRAQKDPPRP